MSKTPIVESEALAHVRASIANKNPTVRNLVAAGLGALKPYLQRGAIAEGRKILESVILLARGEFPGQIVEPIPMVLHCPLCGTQHVDKPEPEIGWTNPPHKSHLCHGCGIVWRPASVPTVGVESVERGTNDTWPLGKLTRQEAEEYRVAIVIQKFRFNKKIGSHARIVTEQNVKSEHGDWSMGDYTTLDKADRVIDSMTTIHPCNHCGARSFSDGSSTGGVLLASEVKEDSGDSGVF